VALEYAPKGLIGVLTPQANTTVEPEFAVLAPPGHGWINARLTSPKATIEERLVDYFDRLEEGVAQFANAPLGSVAFACTGASYLVGRMREDAAVARLCAQGAPFVTTGRAVAEALDLLGARRIALVSPYTPSLDVASKAYWASRGFEVAALASAYRESEAFHPIYSLEGGAASAALATLEGLDVDAVVMLGTGMPTLEAIRRRPRLGRAPVFSCMLALVWRAAAAAQRRDPTRDDLLAWIDARHWGDSPRLPPFA
jgi:maleate isomerase